MITSQLRFSVVNLKVTRGLSNPRASSQRIKINRVAKKVSMKADKETLKRKKARRKRKGRMDQGKVALKMKRPETILASKRKSDYKFI